MEHPLTDNWFVLRDLTRPNAKRPAYRLLEEKGIEVFTPMRWQLVAHPINQGENSLIL
nr:hypothetical protein [Parabacteroides distasonis]